VTGPFCDPRRRRAAYHESGHAVVAWSLGLQVIGIRLLGINVAEAYIADADHLPSIDQIAILEAGVIAGDMSGVRSSDAQEGACDRQRVDAIASRFFAATEARDGGLDPRIGQGRDRARDILVRHSSLLVRLAEEVADLGQLSTIEIRRILPIAPAWSEAMEQA
jgi:hypothetical protein